jgi:UDP-N-acetylenolpyruvoylglucosamine reductase
MINMSYLDHCEEFAIYFHTKGNYWKIFQSKVNQKILSLFLQDDTVKKHVIKDYSRNRDSKQETHSTFKSYGSFFRSLNNVDKD